MAARVYSTRFAAAHDQPGGVPITYTVPTGFTAVVRCIDVFFGTSVLPRSVTAFGSALQVFWYETVNPGDQGWRQWTGRQVLFEGDAFELAGSDTFDCAASGYLLG